MDFLSAFVMRNYEYPGQSPLWVFTYIFFGWIGMCGICLFVAEGILARPDQDMLTQPRLWWQVPLATGAIAVVLDLFNRPCCRRGGLLDLVGEGHGLLRYSLAQLRGLVCTHVSDPSLLDLDRPTA